MDIQLPNIEGVSARPFAGGDEYLAIARVFHAEAKALGQEILITPEEFANAWDNSDDFVPTKDVQVVELDGDIVGYVLTRWFDEVGGPRVYRHICKLVPEHEGRGIGTAMLRWAQGHLADSASTHDVPEKVYRTSLEDEAKAAVFLLSEDGYKDIQHDATLVRPDLEDIGRSELPAAVEIRPVTEDQFRTIWEADTEAFRDHWGFVEPTEKDYRAWFLEFPHRDESMWKVAWHGDQVVGQVRSFINKAENEEFGRKRGWIEFISTAREWRGQGIATALINESLREVKERGMEEGALGVHVENPNGAFRLYNKLGFELADSSATYEKPLEG